MEAKDALRGLTDRIVLPPSGPNGRPSSPRPDQGHALNVSRGVPPTALRLML